MSDPIRRRGAGWWVVALTVVFAAAGATVLFRPVGGDGKESQPKPPVRKVDLAQLDEKSADKVLREQASIFDPTPLFLPTKWNASQRPLPPAVEPQPGQVFSSYGAKLVFGMEELKLPLEAKSDGPETPLDMLKEPPRDPFIGFDRQDVPLTPLPERFGVVEVRGMEDGRMTAVYQLNRAVVLPPGRLDWHPAEYVMTVTIAGLLGRPVNTVSSDVEEVDAFLRDYLEKGLHLGERLAPGTYHVVVGP